MRSRLRLISTAALFGTATALCVSACSSHNPSNSQFDDRTGADSGAQVSQGSIGNGELGGPGFAGTTDQDAGSPSNCVGLQCQQHACADAKATTTVSGTVYDPAGKNPLYNVVVYVPNAPVDPIKLGATCDSCSALYSGHPITTTLTDAAGHFQLTNVPDGPNIPLVIQVGKWRKQITIPNITRCQDNPQPDKSLTLPKNHHEGDIPNIAISTGGADTLECLLHRVGLDDAEYGAGPDADGRIHIFGGAKGATSVDGSTSTSPKSEDKLWDNDADLMKYDLVLLSCEGAETQGAEPQNLLDYLNAGGRVFASHYHYAWFNAAPFPNNIATWTRGAKGLSSTNADIITTLANGQPFVKGQAFKDWLSNVNALTGDKLHIDQARHNADVSSANPETQAWIVDNTGDGSGKTAGTVYLSFNTPFAAAAENQCGRAVFSGLHVGAASGDYPQDSHHPNDHSHATAPSQCGSGDLTAQEKALEFMLFDLSSCVIADSQPPTPPPANPIVK